MGAIYILEPNSSGGYQCLLLKNEGETQIMLDLLIENRKVDDWRALEVEIDPEDINLKSGDIFRLGVFHVFSEKAVNILQDILEKNGQLLQLNCDGKILYLYQLTKRIDPLNHELCIFTYSTNGKKRSVTDYNFDVNKIKGEYIFRILEPKNTTVYVNQDFVNLVNQNELKGFYFKLIWSYDY